VGVGVITFGVGVIEANVVGVELGRLVGVVVGVFVAVAFTVGVFVAVAFTVGVLVAVADAVAEALACGEGVGLDAHPATAIANTSKVTTTMGNACFIYLRIKHAFALSRSI